MALPPAVQAQVEQANKLIAAAAASSNPSQNVGPAGANTPATLPSNMIQQQPPGVSSPQPQPAATHPQGQIPQQYQQQPPGSPAQQADPNDPAYWRSRFQTAEGITKAQQRRMGELEQTITELQRKTAEILAASPSPQASPNAPRPGGDPEADPLRQIVMSKLSKQELQDYGPEFVDMQVRITREVANALVQPLQTKMDSLSRVAESVEQRHNKKLIAAVPALGEINNDKRFIGWLQQQVDPVTGASGLDTLREADRMFDTETVIGYFKAFAESFGQGTGQRPPGAIFEPNPGNSFSQDPNNPNRGKKVWTTSEIARLSADHSRGKFRNDMATYQSLMNDAMVAQSEGRLVVDS